MSLPKTPSEKTELFNIFKPKFDILVLVLAIAYFVLMVWGPFIEVSVGTQVLFQAVKILIIGIFLIEAIIMSYLYEDTLGYLRKNINDVFIVVLSLLALSSPVLIDLFSLNSESNGLLVIAAINLLLVFSAAAKALGEVHTFFPKRGFLQLCFAFLILAFISIWLILELESSSPDTNITSIEDAMWWFVITVSTVGYGDTYPVSTAGRLLGLFVVIFGLGSFGLIVNYIVQAYINRGAEKQEKKDREMIQITQKLAILALNLDLAEGDMPKALIQSIRKLLLKLDEDYLQLSYSEYVLRLEGIEAMMPHPNEMFGESDTPIYQLWEAITNIAMKTEISDTHLAKMSEALSILNSLNTD